MKQPFLCAACAFLNIVFVNASDIWTSFRPGSGYGNRNEFVIEEAVSDESFVLGKDVYSWKSARLGKHVYAVGLMPRGLTIIKAGVCEDKNVFKVNHTIHDLELEPKGITLHGCWNKTARKTELVLAVAVHNQSYEIHWYKIQDNLKMEKLWVWPVCKKIHFLEFFKQNRLHKLLLVTEDEVNNAYADTYEFLLHEKQFWLTQSIPLANPTASSAISTAGPNYYLSIPQKSLNAVLVFEYSEGHFIPFKNITCNNADFVVSFKVSFKSYLAVAGDNGGIFEFYKNNLRKIEVQGSSLEGVRFWFPIPVNNFREEVVLLVQRSVETESHSVWHLEAVLHNENKFTLHEEFHCKFHGEERTGLRCMADEDRKNGIIGLTTLSVGQTLGLLVPRAGDAPSGLLMLRTDMKSLSSEVNEEIRKLDETKAQLERLLEKHKKRVDGSKTLGSSWTSSAAFQAPPVAAFEDEVEWVAPEHEGVELQIRELEMGVDALKMQIGTMQKQFNEYMEARHENRFDSLVFNGVVKVEGAGNFGEAFVKNINGQDVDGVLNNAARPPYVGRSISSKEFQELKVKNLYFENVNGIPAQQLVFADEDEIKLNGDIVFKESVTVPSNVISTSGRVNEVILDEEVITTGKNYDGQLLFDNLKLQGSAQVKSLNRVTLHSNYLNKIPPVSDLTNLHVLDLDNLFIPVDINVKNVNGEDFDDFLKSLVMKNMNTEIPGNITLDGNLDVVNASTANYLNDLKFPEEFLLRNHPSHYTKISGKKHFTNAITANEITCESLNGINTENMINLSKNQTIPATLVFENLEITERLIVDDDKVIDENLLKIRPSLTLEETNVINSKVNFEDFEVDGILTVLQNFNGTNFEKQLNSVIYKDDPVAEVNSVKAFPEGLSVKQNLDIRHNAINNISLDSFVLKDSDEPLQIHKLKGNITFNNLHLKGLYNGINVTKLDEETVKNFGEQYISSNLRFEDLHITQLFINETLNGVPIENYLFADGDRVFEGSVQFDSVLADNLRVHGNFKAPLKNFNIVEFDRRRLSHTREQLLIANYTIARAQAKKVVATEVNGVAFVDLFGSKITAKQLVELAQNGSLKIKDLYVDGSLFLDNINGVPSSILLGNDAWQNKLNNQDVSLVIKRNARFGHVVVKNLDSVDFENFTREIIFKNESNVEFSKDIVFTKGITVFDEMKVKKINGIPLNQLSGSQKTPAVLNISRDLYINSDVTIDNINGFPLRTLGAKVETLDGTLKLNSDINITNNLETEEAWIKGNINRINVSDILANVVFLDENAVFSKKTVFQKPVHIGSNFGVKESVDGINLPALMKSVVLKTKDAVVPSEVVFTKPVIIQNSLDINRNLITGYLDGCDIAKWKANALFINRGLLNGSFIFEDVIINDVLYTTFVNKVDMKYLIPLRTDQQITKLLRFGEVSSYRNVAVANFVNQRELNFEFRNTFMNGFNQTVPSNIAFEEEVFAANVEATAKINGRSLKNIVTTYTDQTLVASYDFSKNADIKGDLYSNGTLNGININNWYRNGLKKHVPQKLQKVNGRWVVYGNLEFLENVDGSGNINGLELSKALQDLERKKAVKYIIEKDVMKNYSKACEDVNHILRESKKQIHSFKYFELFQTVPLYTPIQNVHHFTVLNKNYLLISEQNNCVSHLLVWQENRFQFVRSLEIGLIAQTITVKVRDLVFIVTRRMVQNKSCEVDGTNIWLFQDQALNRIKQLKESHLLQSSRRPGAFYSVETDGVAEYRITNFGQTIRKYRKWYIRSDESHNFAFLPRNVKIGLALVRNGELVKLVQDEPEERHSFKGILNGTYVFEPFSYPFNGNEVVVLNVGIPGKSRGLVAFATQENSSIGKGLDLVKVYEDVTSKRLYQNIPTYKPSSLTSVELENGETLLTFLEDGSTFQVYEYKGIEGFKRRSSAQLKGNKLFVVYLGSGENKRTILGVIDKNRISFLDAVMIGNKLDVAELNCEL